MTLDLSAKVNGLFMGAVTNRWEGKPPSAIQKTGRTGWYYRVLETGTVRAGDILKLIARPQPSWSVRKVTQARLTRQVHRAEAEVLADMPELAMGWRLAFTKMAAGDRAEDTSARLGA